jgi:hypothetical protein
LISPAASEVLWNGMERHGTPYWMTGSTRHQADSFREDKELRIHLIAPAGSDTVNGGHM